jgi:LPPG:FO 2-phospho-L-lactate transferase
VKPKVLPMSDQLVPTFVKTDEGSLPFQEYFVHRRCEPIVKGFEFRGAESAHAAPGVLEAIEAADAIVICPSNPWVSIGPILAISEIRNLIFTRPAFAVSPIIGGVALKGPAAKMYTEMGITPSAVAVASHYGSLIRGMVIDRTDSELLDAISRYTMCALATDTIMKSPHDRQRLAEVVIDFVGANLP